MFSLGCLRFQPFMYNVPCNTFNFSYYRWCFSVFGPTISALGIQLKFSNIDELKQIFMLDLFQLVFKNQMHTVVELALC